jgi:diguanylate cyclase (GGDEF)-like protein
MNRTTHRSARAAPGRVRRVRHGNHRRRALEARRGPSLYDALTGLPGRALLYDRLRQAIAAARRQGAPLSVLVVDLNNFRDVNDTYGHESGDLMLRQVARRLAGAVRESDTVARLVGDEFAIVLPWTDASGSFLVARKVSAALGELLSPDGRRLELEASIGIAAFPEDGDDAEALLRRADMAMSAAKRSGTGFVLYAAHQGELATGRLALMGELREAIERDELVLHFQPQVDLRTGRMGGVEALVRWQHPWRGLVPPGEFLPLAEQTGLIQPLTLWVLEEALGRCREWWDRGLRLEMIVNLSTRNLQDPELPEAIARLLRASGLPSHALRLEITESAVMANPTRAAEMLEDLRAMGVRFSIDDFGTGYSSLAYLKKLPVDELKIDRSFVMDMLREASDRAIVRAIIEMGHSLGLKVVAEGVEDGETLEALAGLGCDTAQGYFISRPVPAPELERWLESAPWRPVGASKGVGTVPAAVAVA